MAHVSTFLIREAENLKEGPKDDDERKSRKFVHHTFGHFTRKVIGYANDARVLHIGMAEKMTFELHPPKPPGSRSDQ
jgi:hypothetical protein